MKQTTTNGIKKILVPADTNKDMKINGEEDEINGQWKEIHDCDEIYEVILQQNAKMLIKSKDGITATGKLGKELKRDASNEDLVRKILNGDIDPAAYGKEYPQFKAEAEEFIRQMKSDPRSHEMEWTFNSEDYRSIFNHTHESKSCRPSGLHMSHWKPAVEDDFLTELHANMT